MGKGRKRLSRLLVAGLLLASLVLSPLANAEVVKAAVKKTVANGGKLSLQKGKQLKLYIKGCKKKAKWSSSKKNIVSVKGKGKFAIIKGKKAGTAVVTAKVGKKKYRCQVKVTKKSGNTEDDSQSQTGGSDNTGNDNQNQTGGGDNTGNDNQNQTGGGDNTGNDNSNTETGGNNNQSSSGSGNGDSNTGTGGNNNQSGSGSGNEGGDTGNSGNGGTSSSQSDYDASTVSTTDYAKYFSLHAIHKSTATYYDNGYTNTCCNLDDIAAGYDVAAINEYDYGNGIMAGAYLEVTGPKGKVNVLVTDLMPYVGNEANCYRGALDLNENTFAKIADKVDGKVDISWKVIAFPTTEPIQYKFKDTSTQWWCEIQVRNQRYPVLKCEVKNSDGSYTELPRMGYNYFKAENGLGTGPYTLRVTDIFGHVLEDTVPLSPGKIVGGKSNFPVME